MALLDGGMLRRHKSWLKAEPPTILVVTLGSLCQMIDKQILKLDSMQVLVIDEAEFMFNSSKQVSSLRKLLISYSLRNNRQTDDVVHVHVNIVEPMPSRLHHGFVSDAPHSAIIFFRTQSEK
ncbi:hypothetical protein CsSME_00020980 [Camellia sinensis var. sinensis]